jgi:hypothetical protein
MPPPLDYPLAQFQRTLRDGAAIRPLQPQGDMHPWPV